MASYKKNFVLIIITFIVLLSARRSFAEGSWESALSAQLVSEQIGALNSKPIGSEDCKKDVAQCLPLLDGLEKDSQKDGFFGALNSQWKTCHSTALKTSRFGDGKSLAEYLNANPETNIGEVNYSRLNSCLAKASGDTRTLAAKYYYLMNRIQIGASESIEQVAAIDNLLGEKQILINVSCGHGILPKTTARCEELKSSCTSEKSLLKKLAADSANAEDQLGELNRRQIEMQTGAKDPATLSEFRKASDLISAARESIYLRYPWLKGRTYQDARDNKATAEEALRAQMKSNREQLMNRYNSLRSSALCLNGAQSGEPDCQPENFKATVANAPDFSAALAAQGSLGSKHKSISATEWLQSSMCTEHYVNDRDATAEILETASVQLGLTFVSFGIAPLALSARLPALARVGAAGATATAYSASTAPHIQEAYRYCAKEKETLAETAKNSSVASAANNKCPSAESPLAQAQSNFDKCVSASLMIALDIATGVPGAMQMARITADNAKRIQQAEQLLARTLSPTERQALIKAHETGKIRVVNGKEEYSPADIRAKAKILRNGGQGGFSAKETRALMESKLAGRFTNNPVDSAKLGDEVLFTTKDGQYHFGEIDNVTDSRVYLKAKDNTLRTSIKNENLNTKQFIRSGDYLQVKSLSGNHYGGKFVRSIRLPTGDDAIVILDDITGEEHFLRMGKLDLSTLRTSDVVTPGDYFQVVSKSGNRYFGRFSQRHPGGEVEVLDGETGRTVFLDSSRLRTDGYKRYSSYSDYERELKAHKAYKESAAPKQEYSQSAESNRAYEEAQRRAQENAKWQQREDPAAAHRRWEEEARRAAEERARAQAQAQAEARAQAAREQAAREQAARAARERAEAEARARASSQANRGGGHSPKLTPTSDADRQYVQNFQSASPKFLELRNLAGRGGRYSDADFNYAKSLIRSLNSSFHTDKYPGMSTDFAKHADEMMKEVRKIESSLREIKGGRL